MLKKRKSRVKTDQDSFYEGKPYLSVTKDKTDYKLYKVIDFERKMEYYKVTVNDGFTKSMKKYRKFDNAFNFILGHYND